MKKLQTKKNYSLRLCTEMIKHAYTFLPATIDD